MDTIRLIPVGDTALCVEFGSQIDPAINARVLSLDAAMAGEPGIVETVPTYRSLLVRYDPLAITADEIGERVRTLARDHASVGDTGRTWVVPVAYGGPYGIDLDATAERHGLDAAELIRRHAAPTYRVYMVGFLPGFAYLGGLDPSIATPRRTSPRLKTPPGTISIGGVQALVASLEAPSGWHLLGRTPVRNFEPSRDPAVLIGPGDRVRFRPIAHDLFAELDGRATAGELVATLDDTTDLARSALA